MNSQRESRLQLTVEDDWYLLLRSPQLRQMMTDGTVQGQVLSDLPTLLQDNWNTSLSLLFTYY